MSAATLAAAFQTDPIGARKLYGRRVLELSGAVISRTPGSRSVAFETPTATDVKVSAVFGTAQFAKVPPDATALTVRGVVLAGPPRQVRLDLAEVVAGPDVDSTDITTDDYLPAIPSSEWQVVRVTYPELFAQAVPTKLGRPAPKNPKTVPAAAVRLVYRVGESGRVRAYPVQVGEFTGPSLLAPDAVPVKWAGKPTAPGVRFTEFAYRVTPTAVEVSIPSPGASPAAPPVITWEPILRLGLRGWPDVGDRVASRHQDNRQDHRPGRHPQRPAGAASRDRDCGSEGQGRPHSHDGGLHPRRRRTVAHLDRALRQRQFTPGLRAETRPPHPGKPATDWNQAGRLRAEVGRGHDRDKGHREVIWLVLRHCQCQAWLGVAGTHRESAGRVNARVLAQYEWR